MNFLSWRKRDDGPSEEAVKARDVAQALVEKADEVYYERRYLLKKNHFAERIRLTYEAH